MQQINGLMKSMNQIEFAVTVIQVVLIHALDFQI